MQLPNRVNHMQAQKRVVSLFYNKFMYGLKLNNIFFGIFRNKNLRVARSSLDTINFVLESDPELITPKYLKNTDLPSYIRNNLEDTPLWKSRLHYVDALSILNFLRDEDTKCRAEYPSHLTVYNNDRQAIQDLQNNLRIDSTLYAPHVDDEALLLSEPDIELVPTEPTYRYKCYFNTKARRIQSFADYCTNNRDNIRAGERLLTIMRKGYIVDGQSFYVKNDKMLMLVKLMLGDKIGRIKKLLCNDKYIYGNEQ